MEDKMEEWHTEDEQQPFQRKIPDPTSKNNDDSFCFLSFWSAAQNDVIG